NACALMLGNADFAFVEAPAEVERNITMSSSQLREYLARLPVTSETPDPPLPSLDAVPQPVNGSSGATAEQLVLDRTAVQVLVLVDGQRTVREIVGDRPVLPVMRSLMQLAHSGLIALNGASAPAPVAAALVAPAPAPVAIRQARPGPTRQEPPARD